MSHTLSCAYLPETGGGDNTFGAIVIGSGISGGWAAKELCEQGVKTLVLERGRPIEHIKDYPTATMNPWEFKHRGALTQAFLDANPLISRAAGFGEDTAHFFIQDKDHPYVQEKPFDWIRGYQVGGKSIIWGRACQRWSDFEFTAPARFSYGIDWPIRYADVAPWYAHVEKFIGVCGHKDGLEAMPDGEFMKPFDLNCVEAHIQRQLKAHYNDRFVVQARWAQLTEPQAIHHQQGRAGCQARNLCMRGCPYGGYFSSVSSTLPWAQKTGNLTIRPFSVVHSILYDEKKNKAIGVRVIDANTHQTTDYFARVIFLNASALNSNLILLNSTSRRFPNGLGNDSGLLGKYVAFHNYRASVSAAIDGFEDQYYYGRNPTEPILVNYRNLHKQDTDYVGGFTTFMGAYRSRGPEQTEPTFGAAYKEGLTKPGGWRTYMYMQGETIPKASNHVRLSTTQTDQWGIPLLVTSVGYDDNDEKMVADFLTQSADMLAKAGCTAIQPHDSRQAPGLDIHEMGGARMGHDPKTSVLNQWNQLHHCLNVFVTDGACMTSTGNQSPSILYMALTARAATHAVAQMKQEPCELHTDAAKNRLVWRTRKLAPVTGSDGFLRIFAVPTLLWADGCGPLTHLQGMSWFIRKDKGIQTPTELKRETPDGLWYQCPNCKKVMNTREHKHNAYTCVHCNYHEKIGSEAYFGIIFDENEFTELDGNMTSADPLQFTDSKSYADRIRATVSKTGLNDAVRTGYGRMNDMDVTIACMDFGFIGGSMGSVVGEKIARAIQHALDTRTPFLMISRSGGARMMEAGFSLMQMAKTSAKLALLSKAGVPYISLLTDPTTGGVTASFAMLGDFNIAEPQALIGFAGPRVIRETIGKDLPKDFQSAEFVLEHGFLDFIVDRKDLKDKLSSLLKMLQ